jgi:hypothetical protein
MLQGLSSHPPLFWIHPGILRWLASHTGFSRSAFSDLLSAASPLSWRILISIGVKLALLERHLFSICRFPPCLALLAGAARCTFNPHGSPSCRVYPMPFLGWLRNISVKPPPRARRSLLALPAGQPCRSFAFQVPRGRRLLQRLTTSYNVLQRPPTPLLSRGDFLVFPADDRYGIRHVTRHHFGIFRSLLPSSADSSPRALSTSLSEIFSCSFFSSISPWRSVCALRAS